MTVLNISMRPWSKTAGICIGVLAASLFILAASLFSYAQTDHFRDIVLKRINASIAGNLTIGGHDIAFLQGSIVLENLIVKAPSGRRIASLDYLLADIAWLPLLKRTVVIESLSMKHPDIQLGIGKKGTMDITEAFKASSQNKKAPARKLPGFPFDVVAQNLRITDGDVHIFSEADDLRMDLRGMTIQARGNLFKQTGDIRIEVADTVLAYGTRDLKIHPAALSVVLQEDRIAAVAFAAKTDFAEIVLDGEIGQVFHDPNLNLRLAFEGSLSELSGLMTLPREYSGKAKGVLTVQGNWRDPDADISLAYNGGFVAGYPVEGIRAAFSLKNRRLQVQHLDIMAGSGDINLIGHINLQGVFPEGLVSSRTDPDKIDYTLEASLKHFDAGFLSKGVDRFNGYLNATAAFEGKGFKFNSLSASVTIDALLDSFFLEGMVHPTALTLNTSATIEAGVIESNQMTIRAAGIRLNARGSVDMASGHIHGQLNAVTDNIENSFSLLGKVGSSGPSDVQVDVSGFWRRPDIGIEMTGKQMRLDNIYLGDIDLRANVDQNGLLNILSVKLVNQETRAQGEGTIQLFTQGFQLHETMPLKAKLAFADARPLFFSDDPVVNGSFDGELQIDGAIRSLQGSAVLGGRDVTYDKMYIGDVNTRLRFFNGGFHLDQFQLRHPSATYTLSGGIQVFEPNSWHRLAEPVLNLSLRGDGVSIEDFLPEIKGGLYLDAHLEGPVSGLKGQGHIRGENLDLYEQSVRQLTLDLALKENRLHIQPLQVFLDPQNVVKGSGWIGFDGSFSFALDSMDLPLESINRIREMEKVQGKADLHVTGEGNVKDPAIFGDIHLKEVLVNNEIMDDFIFHVALENNKMSIEGRQTFELNAVYHLLNKDFIVDLLFADTDVSPVFLSMGKKDIGGRLTGKILAEGNTGSLDKSEALLDFSKVSLTYRGEVIANSDSVQGNMRNQGWSIPEFQLNFLQSGRLRIKGTGNFDGYVELIADGTIPATAAMPFVKDIKEVDGKIGIHAAIKGPAAGPEMSGEIQIDDVGCTLPQIDMFFKSVNGKIRLSPSLISIENLTGNVNTGMFQVKGDVILENYRPSVLKLEVETNKIPIHVPGTMDMLIDTKLGVAGLLENLTIKGDIALLEGVYYKNVTANLLQGMKGKKRTEDLPAKKGNHPLFDKMKFDIQLKYREPFLVDNNIAHLEIHPDLTLSGTLGDPVITGIAKVREGTLTYQNKAFVVEKGVVSFVNPYKIEPDIDIRGHVQIRQWRITLALNGTPDRLVVELSSTPSEEDADILSILLFGKTTDEMRGANNGGVDSTEVLLAQVMSSSFGTDIKKTTGLDYLEVETVADEVEGESDTIQVTVGKDLTERMTVKYTIGSGKSGYHQRAATEYKLIEYLLLGGFQDIEGNYGGEIIFRVEFRMFQ